MANSTIRKIQENIKKYRQEKNYTQSQLSEMSDISSDYLSEIERGKKIPSVKSLLKIAEALEIPIALLFD